MPGVTIEWAVWTQPGAIPGVGPIYFLGPQIPASITDDDGDDDVDVLGVFFREHGGTGVMIGPQGPRFPEQITPGWSIALAGAHLHITAGGTLVYDGRTRPETEWRALAWAAAQAGEGIVLVGTPVPDSQRTAQSIDAAIKSGRAVAVRAEVTFGRG